MSNGEIQNKIVDDEAHECFLLTIDGSTADLVYHVVGDRFIIDHTGVPPHLEGGGIGSQLVIAAIKKASASGLTVVPSCPFAKWWIDKHPQEFAELTAKT